MTARQDNLPERGAWRVVPLGSTDIPEAVALFHATVHAVNARNYSPAQLELGRPPTTSTGDISRKSSKASSSSA